MQQPCLFNPRDYLCSLLCDCCQRRRGRMERAYVKARTKLEKEIDVIEIIRMRRYLKAAMKMLLSPEQVISLKN